MKRILLAATLLVTLPALAADEANTASGPYTTEADKVAYSAGYINGKLHQQVEGLNVDVFAAGFLDAYARKTPAMTEEEMRATVMAYRQKMDAEAAAKAQQEALANKQKGADYLAANAKKRGVKTTKSGLQYEVLKKGKGPKPTASDKVKAHYTVQLIDGKVIDSSIARKEPAVLPVSPMIPGWTEALQMMPVGSKYRLTLAPALAYGEEGSSAVPPNSVLVFEVELLNIEPAAAAEQPAPEATPAP
jgi:FKBP-type peptidyl-prolyl cis-trans isomerase FklB